MFKCDCGSFWFHQLVTVPSDGPPVELGLFGVPASLLHPSFLRCALCPALYAFVAKEKVWVQLDPDNLRIDWLRLIKEHQAQTGGEV